MELTREEIAEIDILLKRKGIRYWDIRIEMVDHIATLVEANMIEGQAFNVALRNALEQLDWTGSLANQNRLACKEVNKKYRALYVKEIFSFFTQARNLIVLAFFLLIEYTIANIVSLEQFTEINYQLFLLPFIVVIYYGVLNLKNKLGRSIYHIQGFFYMVLSFPIINTVLLITVAKNMFSLKNTGMIIVTTLLVTVHFILSYAGVVVYKKAQTDAMEIKKALGNL
jgi:hypothetical protein